MLKQAKTVKFHTETAANQEAAIMRKGFYLTIYARLEGTMYIPMRADSRMQLVKNRALELKSHLDLLKESQ
jgi:hypothetical protein